MFLIAMVQALSVLCALFLAGVNALIPQRSPLLLQNAASPRSFSSSASATASSPRARFLMNSRLVLLETKNGNDGEIPEDDTLYFDDFDFVIGGDGDAAPPPATDPTSSESTPAWKNKLNERIKETQEQEIYRDTKLMQSWKQGDWSVRGFSLDPYDALNEATVENQNNNVGNGNIAPVKNADPITVSKVVKDVNSDGERIWVGRSNGSLFWIQLGTEYTTHFRSKLSGQFSYSDDDSNNPEDDDKPSASSVKIGSELVRDSMQLNPFLQEGADEPPPLERPFSILAQFSPASPGSAPISTILSVPEEDCVFTACQGSGQIQQWHINEDDIITDSPTLKTPIPLSDGIHNGAIVTLKIVSFKVSSLLLSVGDDGTLALWDVPSADLVYHCQISLEDIGDIIEETTSPDVLPTKLVHSADVNEDKIFLGTASGYVLGYNVADLMTSASSGSASCPLPQGKFKAHDSDVTAIACGGPGTLGRSGAGGDAASDKTSSCVLLTGGGNGVVKQWEILSSPNMQKMENWPKLSTQRLPKKAHLFEGHDAPITALESMGGRKPQFLSASMDGTIRAWDSAKGKESYRMDGFSEDLSSLCLQGGSDTDDDLLITNGMNQYVCVHDFTDGMGDESVDDFFEQWDD